MTLKPSEILDGAAVLIEARAVDVPGNDGLVRKDWYLLIEDAPGEPRDPAACPVCTSAAINVAGGCAPDDPEPSPEVIAALEVFVEHLGLKPKNAPLMFVNPLQGAIAAWHDEDAKSAAHVAAELRAAAKADRDREARLELVAEVERLRTEVEQLRDDSAKLNALEIAGVDNWEGYGTAMAILAEEAGDA